jgi:hypothetical protein
MIVLYLRQVKRLPRLPHADAPGAGETLRAGPRPVKYDGAIVTQIETKGERVMEIL